MPKAKNGPIALSKRMKNWKSFKNITLPLEDYPWKVYRLFAQDLVT